MKKTRDKNRRLVIWLTEKEKAQWLKKLDAAAADGEVDAEFLPYLREINGLNGVCTCFCCIGHERENNGHKVLNHGYLVMRVKKSVEKYFWQTVFPAVARINGISSIEIDFKREVLGQARGDYPLFQFNWRRGSWPRVIGPIMKALRELEEK